MYIHHTSKWVQWFHLSWVECSRCLDTRDTFIPASDYLYPIKRWHLIYHTRKLLDWMLLTRIFITSDDREAGSICSQLTLLIRKWNARYYPFFSVKWAHWQLTNYFFTGNKPDDSEHMWLSSLVVSPHVMSFLLFSKRTNFKSGCSCTFPVLVASAWPGTY